jgi:hypothetical protein
MCILNTLKNTLCTDKVALILDLFIFNLSRSIFSNEFLSQTDELNETFLSSSDMIKFKKYKEIMVE